MEKEILWRGNGGGDTKTVVPGTKEKKKKIERQKNLNSCSMCIRYLLIISNCVFLVVGCTVIGFGIYIIAEKVHFVTALFGTTLVAPASYLIVTAGCLVFVGAFIGCFGALLQNRILLIIYLSALGLIIVLSVVGFVLAIIFKSEMNDQIREYMRRTLQNDYGVNLENDYNEWVTKNWNQAQEEWHCCSVEDQSWGTYRQSQWYNVQPGVPDLTRPYVPPSCCVKDQYNQYVNLQQCQLWNYGPPGKQSGTENSAIFYRGCYEEGKEVMYDISAYIIGTGITMMVLAAGEFVLAILLVRKV